MIDGVRCLFVARNTVAAQAEMGSRLAELSVCDLALRNLVDAFGMPKLVKVGRLDEMPYACDSPLLRTEHPRARVLLIYIFYFAVCVFYINSCYSILHRRPSGLGGKLHIC